MSMYSLEDLIARWKREELTAEQLLGQLLQRLAAQQQTLQTHDKRLQVLEREVRAERGEGR